MTAPQHSLDTSAKERLGIVLGALIEEMASQAVQTALARQGGAQEATGASPEPEWISQAEASRLLGPSAAWFRTQQRLGRLTAGRRGRVRLAEARAFLGKAVPEAPAPVVLTEERAKRAAAAIRRKLERAGGRDGR